jgi:hypothetical protein
MGFKTANSEGNHLHQYLTMEGKSFNTRSSVSQNAINDNNYSFDLFATYTKTLAENHKFVGVIGNTIFKEYGNGLFATGFDIPNNSWDNADNLAKEHQQNTSCRILCL